VATTTAAPSITLTVQSTSSAGPDRVNVAFTQVTDAQATSPTPMMMGSTNLNLNLSQDEAAGFVVNDRYTLTLAKTS